MNTVSPIFYACAEGSLANATLCAAARAEAPAAPESEDFDAHADKPAAPRCEARSARWRRVLDAVLSPISGPKLTV